MSVSSVSLTEEVVRATQCQVEVQLTVENFSFADLSCRLEYGPNRDISKGIICHDFRRFESAAPTVRSHFEMENTIQNSGFHILAVAIKPSICFQTIMCMTGRDGTHHCPAPTVRLQVLFALDTDSEKMETRGIYTVRDGLCDVTIKRTAEPDAQVGRRNIHNFVLLMAEKRDDAYMKLLLVTVVNYDDFTHLRAPTSTLVQHLRY